MYYSLRTLILIAVTVVPIPWPICKAAVTVAPWYMSRVATFAKFTVKEAFLNLTVPLMKAQSFDLVFSLKL